MQMQLAAYLVGHCVSLYVTPEHRDLEPIQRLFLHNAIESSHTECRSHSDGHLYLVLACQYFQLLLALPCLTKASSLSITSRIRKSPRPIYPTMRESTLYGSSWSTPQNTPLRIFRPSAVSAFRRRTGRGRRESPSPLNILRPRRPLSLINWAQKGYRALVVRSGGSGVDRLGTFRENGSK